MDRQKKRRRGGLLTAMMERQVDVKSLLKSVREIEDKTVLIAVAGNNGYDDEIITALILAFVENGEDPERQIVVPDLLWAGALLDHLDTQGFEITRKKLKRPENDR